MTMNAWDRMTGAGVGSPEILSALEILGDPAMAVPTQADRDVTKYLDAGYKASDKIYFGVGNNATLAAGATGIVFQQQVQTPFKPLKLTFPSQYCPDVLINQVQIGSVLLLEGNPIPIEVWSEVSRNNQVSWPTLDTSQSLIITLTNAGLVDVLVNIGSWGIRLRKG